MKISFSTLACPNWKLDQAAETAAGAGYDGLELRFLEGEDSLWKLSVFQGTALQAARRMFSDLGISVACVDTSCRFHSPDPKERAFWIEEGVRMAELAAALDAPGIRVFGDKIQPDADRASTRMWIGDGIRQLAERIAGGRVEVWLETHGDFASSAEILGILEEAGRNDLGVVWDPANAFTDANEEPLGAAGVLGSEIRHVHLKDLTCAEGVWKPVLSGEGQFPLREIICHLAQRRYDGFVSFEWEKKWHPELADPEIAVPHFARWFRNNFQDE